MAPEFDLSHGWKGLILSLVVVLLFRAIIEACKFVWIFVNRRKIPTKEEMQRLFEALTTNTEGLSSQKIITVKMSQDMRRIYLFLKVIAGEKWPVYRKQVEDIEKDEVSL